MATKAFLIARVSDPEQRSALPAQIQRLERYAAEKGYDAKLFEFDETAYKDTRSTFTDIVAEIKAFPDPCVVVFDKIDRYSRDSSQKEIKTLDELRRAGKIELHFPSDGLFVYKDSPATDLFRLGIGLALAKYYSDSIRDNVKRKVEQKLRDGEWPGKAPLGYLNRRINEKMTTIDPDPERERYAVKIFELRSQGVPYEAIAKQMFDEGLRSNTAKERRMTKGGIEHIIHNPFYYGVMRYEGKLYPHKYKPLISRKLFNECQAMNEERSNHKTKSRDDDRGDGKGSTFTLNGILKCGYCGCSISSYVKKGHVYMRCTKARGPCPQGHLKEANVFKKLEDVLRTFALTEENVEQVIGELKRKHDDQQEYYTTRVTSIRSEYDSIKQKKRTVYFDKLDQRITLDLHDEIVRDLSDREEELNAELRRLTQNDTSFLVTSAYLLEVARSASTLFHSSKPALQHKLLQFVLSNLTIKGENIDFNLKTPFDVIAGCSQTQNWLPELDSNQQPTRYTESSCFHGAWTISSPRRTPGAGRYLQEYCWDSLASLYTLSPTMCPGDLGSGLPVRLPRVHPVFIPALLQGAAIDSELLCH